MFWACVDLIGTIIGAVFGFIFTLEIVDNVSIGTFLVMLFIISVILFFVFGSVTRKGDKQ